MQITPELIKYLESLARITLAEEEEKKVGAQLQDILTYIDMLNELDTEGIEAMSHSFPITKVQGLYLITFSVPNALYDKKDF